MVVSPLVVRGLVLGTGLIAAACGEEPPTLPGEEAPPCELEASDWVVDVLSPGETRQETGELGRDVDGDGDVENALGIVHSNLRTAGAALQPEIDEALLNGAVRLTLRTERCASGDSDYTRVSLHDGPPGAEPDGEVVAAVGGPVGEGYAAREGIAHVPLSALFDSRASELTAARTTGYALAAELEFVAGDRITGTITLGFEAEEALSHLAPSLARTLSDLALADPGCPLACENETLQVFLNGVDEDSDGLIDAAEVAANAGFFIAVDLDLLAEWGNELVYWPLHDHRTDSASLGLAFDARAAPL